MKLNAFVCPVCYGTLTIGEASLACEGCTRAYPLIGGSMPVLVSDAQALVHRTCAELHRLSAGAGERTARFADAASRSSARREPLRRLSEAYACNRRFITELQDLLQPLTSVEQLLEASRQPAGRSEQPPDYLEQVAGFIRRDWSRQAECEAEIASVMEAIWTALERHAPALDRVLVLGAGAARFAHELTSRVPEVFAIDRSLTMGASVHLLQGGARRFCEICETNVASIQDQVRPFDAAIPYRSPAGASVDRLHYAVADAVATPLASQSISAIVSVYFTDVVPPSQLLPEVTRLLVPNGLFFHFGPLMYHFTTVGEQRTVDELAALFIECGFDIRDERWVSLPHLHSAVRLSAHQVRNWCMSATLESEASIHRIRDEQVPSILGTPTLNLQYRLANGAEQLTTAGLLTADGLQIPIDALALTVLRLVDARRRVEDIVAQAARATSSEASAVVETLRRLVRARIVGMHDQV